MKRRVFINLVGSVAAPLAAHAQAPATAQQTQAMTANLPQIEVVRVKRIDPAAPNFRFRLGDGLIDLMKDFSLSSSQAIGAAGETPPYMAPADNFDERYGRW